MVARKGVAGQSISASNAPQLNQSSVNAAHSGTSARLDATSGSNESNKIFHGPLPHLLIEPAHGMDFEMR
jgi:hypothetical protein